MIMYSFIYTTRKKLYSHLPYFNLS